MYYFKGAQNPPGGFINKFNFTLKVAAELLLTLV